MKMETNVQYEAENKQDTLPFCHICLQSIDKICKNDRLTMCDECYKKVKGMTEDV